VVDDRAFDLECVRSSMAFYNRATHGRWGPSPPPREGEQYESARIYTEPEDFPVSEDSRSATAVFAWLPEVLKKRAQRARIPTSNVPVKIAPINDFFVDTVCTSWEYFFSTWPSPQKWDSLDPGFIVDKLHDRLFDDVAIYQRLRMVDGTPTRVQLPILRDAGNCMVYAMVVYAENRWGLLGRARKCKYMAHPDKEYPHWFLDYRIDASGHLKRGTPQEFCSPEHANRFHQREWRKRQAKNTQIQSVQQPTRPHGRRRVKWQSSKHR